MSTFTAAPPECPTPAAGAAGTGLTDAHLGVVSISRQGADGVSYVARLVDRALADLAGRPPWALDLLPAREGVVTRWERARFFATLAAAEVTGRVDALMFTHLGPARVQRWLPRARRAAYGVFVHGVEMLPQHMTQDRLSVLEGAALRVANSQFTARRVAALYPGIGTVDACPLALLPPTPHAGPVDDAVMARVASAGVVLLVGRMSSGERYKGHDQLIEAWPDVLADVPRAQLVLAGGGDDAERLARKAASAGLGDRVVFAGRVSDATLAALFARASVFAMPSTGEGFGLVYLEAMRAGLPCIASPNDGGADVVVDGETGLLVPQADRAGLGRAVVRLLENPALASSLGAAGRRRYEAHFKYERFRDRFGALVERAFGSATGGSR